MVAWAVDNRTKTAAEVAQEAVDMASIEEDTAAVLETEAHTESAVVPAARTEAGTAVEVDIGIEDH